jgi:hypothetical protein
VNTSYENPVDCAAENLAINEMSDCSSAFKPEISNPLEVSKSIAIAKQVDPTSPEVGIKVVGIVLKTGAPVGLNPINPLSKSNSGRIV